MVLATPRWLSLARLPAHGALPGLYYAEPYLHLPTAAAFVLVDRRAGDAVVGYVLAAADTRAFEQAARETWFPRVRAPYANPPAPSTGATDADKKFIRILHDPPAAPDAAVAYSPAHLHIDILPAYQRGGWGRRLIARAVAHLREERGLERQPAKSMDSMQV